LTDLLRGKNLSASYNGRVIFSGVSLALGPGAYALQGANGSGKSTLLRLLAGAQALDSGSVSIDGHDLVAEPQAARQVLSYVPDESPVYPFMTGHELLAFVAAAKRTALGEDVTRLIAGLGLVSQLEQRFDAMSLGTQKKVLIAAAAICAPRVLLMDEPSNGLDIAARDALAARIVSLKDRTTILFASHDAEFVAAAGAAVLTMAALTGVAA
jgi:ABC-type multidrug transport system ATPase subunit